MANGTNGYWRVFAIGCGAVLLAASPVVYTVIAKSVTRDVLRNEYAIRRTEEKITANTEIIQLVRIQQAQILTRLDYVVKLLEQKK